jgi:hypothetical protein
VLAYQYITKKVEELDEDESAWSTYQAHLCHHDRHAAED